MSRRTFTGREVVKALRKWNFRVVSGGGKGSHVKLRYVHPETGETRTVIVPQHGEIPTGTLKSIAEQAGANDFHEFVDALDELV